MRKAIMEDLLVDFDFFRHLVKVEGSLGNGKLGLSSRQ